MVESAVAAGADGIAIDYTGKAMEAATTDALNANIPVVLYGSRRITGDDAPSDARIAALAFSGEDDSAAGTLLADNWAPTLTTPGCQVLIVNPAPDDAGLTLRSDAVKASLQTKGFTTQDLAASSDQTQNESLIGTALQGNSAICGIVGLDDSAGNAAATYVSSNNLTIPVATFDVDQQAADFIDQGVITMAVNQQPFLQSYFAVSNLSNWIKYSLAPVNVDTGTNLVTKDTIAQLKDCIAAGHC
jgi:simple sugar transport system substrate-binding protein